MSQATKSPNLNDSSSGIPSFSLSHRNQAPEDSLNQAHATNNLLEVTAPSVEYQQLLSAYRSLELERDMLRKALQAFRIGKPRSAISW